MRRFDAVTRIKICERVKSLFESGILSAADVTIALQKEGWKMSNGDPMDLKWVSSSMLKMGLNHQPAISRVSISKRLPDLCTFILMSNDLSDSDKVRMLKNYSEVL
jgi:hypothetical protein